MNTIGRPSFYRPEYARLARNYCRLGATNAELAEFFEVAPRTIGNWMVTKPEFEKAVTAGRRHADAQVANSLHRLAVGYEHEVERVIRCGRGYRTVTYTKRYKPDRKAAEFWLCNRRPDKWSLRGGCRVCAGKAQAVPVTRSVS